MRVTADAITPPGTSSTDRDLALPARRDQHQDRTPGNHLAGGVRLTMRPIVFIALVACGGEKFGGTGTPEQATAGAEEGQHVEITGQVHAVSFDSIQTTARKQQLAAHPDDIEWMLEQDDEGTRGKHPAYDDAGASYRRTPDHYILFRSTKPPAITQTEPDFTPGALVAAWGLGVHVTDIDPARPLPDVGATIKVTGTFRHIIWNQRESMLPIIDDATIEIITDPNAPTAGPGAACTLDQDCNTRMICDRASHTCGVPPREIYWADPWHDVNGACDTDADCPLGQTCDVTHVIAATGMYAADYFSTQDANRHLCVLTIATVAAQCPHIYTTRDLAGGRFASGKEVCVRGTLITAASAADGDTHDQMRVDEPIPYPTADAAYHVFGATTENGPIYKDPTVPGGAVVDPQVGQETIAVGTYRYDPDHGWYEVHPVKAFLTPP